MYFNVVNKKKKMTHASKIADIVRVAIKNGTIETDSDLQKWAVDKLAIESAGLSDTVSVKINRRKDGLIAISKDNVVTAFSFLKAVGSKKEKTAVQLATRAFRNEVEDQIIEMKNETYKSEYGKYHIAHVGDKNEFRHILHSFLEAENIKDIGELKTMKVKMFHSMEYLSDKLCDRTIASKWIEFHRKYAILEVQTASENLRTKRTPYVRNTIKGRGKGRPAFVATVPIPECIVVA